MQKFSLRRSQKLFKLFQFKRFYTINNINDVPTALVSGKYSDVIDFSNRELQNVQNEDKAIHLSNRGTAYLGLKRYDDAIKDAFASIELNPKRHEPYFCAAASYMFKGDYQKAKELFADSHQHGLPTDSYLQLFAQCEKSLGKNPAEIARSIATTGIELSSKEKYDEAFEYFKFALDYTEKEALRLHLQISLCICVLDVLRKEYKRALYVLKQIEDDFEYYTDPNLRESNVSLKKEGEFLRELISKLERNDYNVTFPSLE